MFSYEEIHQILLYKEKLYFLVFSVIKYHYCVFRKQLNFKRVFGTNRKSVH